MHRKIRLRLKTADKTNFQGFIQSRLSNQERIRLLMNHRGFCLRQLRIIDLMTQFRGQQFNKVFDFGINALADFKNKRLSKN